MGSETIITALIAIFLFLLWRITRRKAPNRRDYRRGLAQNKKRLNGKAFRQASKLANGNEIIDSPAAETSEPGIVPEELSKFQLIMVEDLDESTVEEIFQMTEAIRQPHPMFNKLTSGVNDPDELIEIVKSDPEITAKILRTVNSAAFSLSRPINSINHAITYLGISLVRDAATQIAIRNSIETKTPELRRSFL